MSKSAQIALLAVLGIGAYLATSALYTVSEVEQVIITNTIPLNSEKAKCCKKIRQLSVARLLGQAIRSIHEETSVSSLFV